MASVSTGGGNSKADRMNMELNLVPFIDLLSSLVLFLLLSAVWIQMGSVPASVENKGLSQTSDTDTSKLQISLQSEQKIQLTWPAGLAGNLPNTIDSLEKLMPLLVDLQKQKKITAASVSGDDSVPYGFVIRTIDALKNSGLVSVGMSTQ